MPYVVTTLDGRIDHLFRAGSPAAAGLTTYAITDQDAATLIASGANGDYLYQDGAIVHSPLPPLYEPIKDALLAQYRAVRLPVLDALMGIAGRKQRGNKHTMAAAIDAAAQGLLDLPTAPSVVAATDEATLKAALQAEYAAVVGALQIALGDDWPEVQAAFREYDL